MKIDMTDAAAVLSEHIERIEQLESELARTQAEAAAWKELHDKHCAALTRCEGIEMLAGRAIVERVPLWRELETATRARSPQSLTDDQRAALAALDAKTKGETP